MHPDVPEEQAYFDHALDLRERLEANRDRAASLAADPKTAMELRRRVGALGVVDPGQAVAFGRIDADGDRWYIGRGAIWDESNDLVVVNWQAPIAASFYTATPDNPEGLDRRRIFRCRDNRILDIDELVFREVAKAVASGTPPEPVVTDALLQALEQDRSGHLTDIVATIQAEQYEVISRDAEQLLIVQGAPGTGKTVVGLHRVSWLLFNRRDRIKARDVLVVGPNAAFLRYISTVLPSLGDEAVVQLPATALGPRVPIGRVDPPEVRRLKGDRRMLRFVLRGLRNRQRVGRVLAELTVEGRQVVVEAEQLVARARQLTGQPHNEARRHLRTFLIDEVHRQLTRRRFRDPPTLDTTLQAEVAREVDAYLDRAWPKMTPQGFLAELLSARRRREVAAAGLLTAAEIELLALPRPESGSSLTWSADDVPLLDLADSLLNGTSAFYQYIVVDEAQDLSPMQFESIRRRSRTGWMTVLGDLAQATSPWAPSSWEEVARQLRRDQVPTQITELSLGYRLPTEVHEVAMRLLPEIAPDVDVPRPLRSTGDPVAVTAVGPGELAATVVRVVRECGDGLVGVISSAAERDRVRQALEAEGLACADEPGALDAPPIAVVSGEEAKGLEFDHVVVVEPAAIVAEAPQRTQGLRALFVALTRSTRRLALVHAEPLPEVLGLVSPVPGNEAPVIPLEPRPYDEDDLGADDDDVAPPLAVAGSMPGGAGTEYDDWWPDERARNARHPDQPPQPTHPEPLRQPAPPAPTPPPDPPVGSPTSEHPAPFRPPDPAERPAASARPGRPEPVAGPAEPTRGGEAGLRWADEPRPSGPPSPPGRPVTGEWVDVGSARQPPPESVPPADRPEWPPDSRRSGGEPEHGPWPEAGTPYEQPGARERADDVPQQWRRWARPAEPGQVPDARGGREGPSPHESQRGYADTSRREWTEPSSAAEPSRSVRSEWTEQPARPKPLPSPPAQSSQSDWDGAPHEPDDWSGRAERAEPAWGAEQMDRSRWPEGSSPPPDRPERQPSRWVEETGPRPSREERRAVAGEGGEFDAGRDPWAESSLPRDRRPGGAEWDERGRPPASSPAARDRSEWGAQPPPRDVPRDWPARGEHGASSDWPERDEPGGPIRGSARGDVEMGSQRHAAPPARPAPDDLAGSRWAEPPRSGEHRNAQWADDEGVRGRRSPTPPFERPAVTGPVDPARLRWPEPPPPPESPSRPYRERAVRSEWDERGLPAGRAEDADGSRGWREPPPGPRRGPEPERPDRPDRADPARPRWSDQREPSRPPAQGQRRPRTIILNPTGSGTNGAGPDGMAGESLGAGGYDEEQGVTGERPAFPLPATTPGNGIDLRADPFAALDREMARALAKKLAEALKRYATPALVPLVVEQMAEILEVDKPRVTRTGKDITPP